MSPFGNTPEIEELFRQAAEDMGTMDYTPYLLMRGWEFSSHASQPGLDYMRDPLTNQMVLNSIAVNRQMVRDGLKNDDVFLRNARYVVKLPEPLLTEVKAYRERQTAAGLPNYRRVEEIQMPEPVVLPEPALLANPILLVPGDVLTPRSKAKRQKKPKPEPEKPADRSPFGRNFNFGDRE